MKDIHMHMQAQPIALQRLQKRAYNAIGNAMKQLKM
jgi:hypothetical protein